MAKGDDKPPRSMWGPPYSTGKKETISVLRTLNDSRKIPCVAGVRSPRACAITGAGGGAHLRLLVCAQ